MNIVIMFLMSLILTWSIGLSVPLIIRFLILKRPIKKLYAVIIVFIFLFINIVIFEALGSENKTHNALYLVAFVSYYMLIWENKTKIIGWQDEHSNHFLCSKCFSDINGYDREKYEPIEEKSLEDDIYTCDKCGKIFDDKNNIS